MESFLSQEDIDALLDVVDESEDSFEDQVFRTNEYYKASILIPEIVHSLLVAKESGILELMNRPSAIDPFWNTIVNMAVDANEPEDIKNHIISMRKEQISVLRTKEITDVDIQKLKERFLLYQCGIEAIQQAFTLSEMAQKIDEIIK